MRLNLRRGLIAGTALAVVLAASTAARSSTPFQTFVYVLAVALAMVLLAMASSWPSIAAGGGAANADVEQ